MQRQIVTSLSFQNAFSGGYLSIHPDVNSSERVLKLAEVLNRAHKRFMGPSAIKGEMDSINLTCDLFYRSLELCTPPLLV